MSTTSLDLAAAARPSAPRSNGGGVLSFFFREKNDGLFFAGGEIAGGGDGSIVGDFSTVGDLIEGLLPGGGGRFSVGEGGGKAVSIGVGVVGWAHFVEGERAETAAARGVKVSWGEVKGRGIGMGEGAE